MSQPKSHSALLDEYMRLGIVLHEAMRAHDAEDCVDTARQMAVLAWEALPSEIMRGTEGIKTENGWVCGAVGMCVRQEYDYLTLDAFRRGLVDADTALRYCDEVIALEEEKLSIVRSYREMLLQQQRDITERMMEIKLRKCDDLEKDWPRFLEFWQDRKTAIRIFDEKMTQIRTTVGNIPGILQSDLLRQCADMDAADIYWASKRGSIRREKKGRSYALFPVDGK